MLYVSAKVEGLFPRFKSPTEQASWPHRSRLEKVELKEERAVGAKSPEDTSDTRISAALGFYFYKEVTLHLRHMSAIRISNSVAVTKCLSCQFFQWLIIGVAHTTLTNL